MTTEKLTLEQRRNFIESLVKRGRKIKILSLDRDSGISLEPTDNDIHDELETLIAFKTDSNREMECERFDDVIEKTEE